MTALPLITELKAHSLDDGPGIRAVVFFKGCPLSCTWCHNPETISPQAQLRYQAERCIGAGVCAPACPAGAITTSPWQRNAGACNGCNRCVAACPSGALQPVGRHWPVDELLARLLRYQPFFRNSAGGVTLSGGEATMFPDYAGALLRALGEHRIHRLLQTCGLFNWARVQAQMLGELETIYFDLKLMDDALHRRHCGRSNRRILENFRRLRDWASGGRELLPRVPLIPGLTATDENLAAIAGFLRQQGFDRVALLPYNPLWHDKARQLDMAPRFSRDKWLDDAERQRARQHFAGFHVVGLDTAPMQDAGQGTARPQGSLGA